MRMIARFAKEEKINAISHLDTMRAVQRALRRAEMPMRYSQGFNPHPLLAFASALGVGVSSEAEWLDIELEETMSEAEFFERLRATMPPGMPLIEAKEVPEKYPALMSITAFADYEIRIKTTQEHTLEDLQKTTEEMLAGSVMAMKKSKKGIQEVDIAPMIASLSVDKFLPLEEGSEIVLNMRCIHAPSGALNPTLFLPLWKEKCGVFGQERICRKEIWAEQEGKAVPVYAAARKDKNPNV